MQIDTIKSVQYRRAKAGQMPQNSCSDLIHLMQKLFRLISKHNDKLAPNSHIADCNRFTKERGDLGAVTLMCTVSMVARKRRRWKSLTADRKSSSVTWWRWEASAANVCIWPSSSLREEHMVMVAVVGKSRRFQLVLCNLVCRHNSLTTSIVKQLVLSRESFSCMTIRQTRENASDSPDNNMI